MPINIPRSYGLSPSERSACHISNIFLQTLELANNQREVQESHKLKCLVHTSVCIPNMHKWNMKQTRNLAIRSSKRKTRNSLTRVPPSQRFITRAIINLHVSN